ncbi:MAG: D-alanine--D-alanine ligase [Bacteroidetes bacterium]|nr:D-alanine--D-alanine ligase [Bacteroidota bacterium]
MTKKLNIAVIAGGDSGEYKISLKSGYNVCNNLDRARFNPFFIHIKGSSWTLFHNGKKYPVDKNNFSCAINRKKITFDCVFVAIHGTPGEDGKLQGYFDILKIPYTTSGVNTLSVTFNKNICKNIVTQYGIPAPKSILVKKGDVISAGEIIKITGLPCFVKPNNGGSSCGASKVKKVKKLVPAMRKGFKEDTEVLVEEFIRGTELTCGVFMRKGSASALPVTEIVTKNEFFDYEAKYKEGKADEITPARISKKVTKKCRDLTVKIFNILNCRGIARADFIYRNGKLYFLEINTVPGLTEVSIIPKQAKAEGIEPKEFFTGIIEEAMRGGRR